MGEQTGIQWTTHTYNVAVGCTKVSPGCRFCYMYRDAERFGFDANVVRRTAPGTFNAPVSKHGATATKGKPGEWKWPDGDRVFVSSWTDFFHEHVDPFRAEAWDVIRRRPGLVWQILTKRSDRIKRCLPDDWGPGWPNVWLGVSVENQQAVQRVFDLRRVPAAVRFVSAEPLLEGVDFSQAFLPVTKTEYNIGAHRYEDTRAIDWVIVGGESGPEGRCRPFDPTWAEDILGQCRTSGVAPFIKQLGSDWARRTRARDSHGGDPAEWNQLLRVREFPS